MILQAFLYLNIQASKKPVDFGLRVERLSKW